MRTARITLAIAIALLVTVPTVAQEKKKARGNRLSTVAQAMMRMEKLHDVIKGLDLTVEQKEELKKLHEDHGPKMKEMFGKLEDIVTEEQVATAKAAAEKAKEAGKKGRAFFAAVESSIKLTDEQKKKIDELGKEMLVVQRATVKAVTAILTTEQKTKLKATMAAGRKKVTDRIKKKKAE